MSAIYVSIEVTTILHVLSCTNFPIYSVPRGGWTEYEKRWKKQMIMAFWSSSYTSLKIMGKKSLNCSEFHPLRAPKRFSSFSSSAACNVPSFCSEIQSMAKGTQLRMEVWMSLSGATGRFSVQSSSTGTEDMLVLKVPQIVVEVI